MAIRPRKSSRCGIRSVLLALSLILPTAAQSSPETLRPKLNLVVWVHTGIADPGDFGLDTTDLETYFAAQLASYHIESVAVSATAKIPKPAPPNTYLLDFSVDNLHPAERTTWNGEIEKVFDVGLSLNLKNLASGRAFDAIVERYEYNFDVRGDNVQFRRRAIYNAADNLAERFVDEWVNGKYGDSLPASQAPTFLERAPWWLLLLLLGMGVLALVLVGYIIVQILDALFHVVEWILHALLHSIKWILDALVSAFRRPSSVPAAPANSANWDIELKEAFALKLKTDNFSEAVRRKVARERRSHLLATHADIEEKEATRLLNAKHREVHYQKLASYAVVNSGLDESQVIETVRNADVWEYRVLQEAKRQAAEDSK